MGEGAGLPKLAVDARGVMQISKIRKLILLVILRQPTCVVESGDASEKEKSWFIVTQHHDDMSVRGKSKTNRN